jgi:hypothetical protein
VKKYLKSTPVPRYKLVREEDTPDRPQGTGPAG